MFREVVESRNTRGAAGEEVTVSGAEAPDGTHDAVFTVFSYVLHDASNRLLDASSPRRGEPLRRDFPHMLVCSQSGSMLVSVGRCIGRRRGLFLVVCLNTCFEPWLGSEIPGPLIP